MSRRESYGLHLTLELVEMARPWALDSPREISSFLAHLVTSIGMRILAGPLLGQEAASAEKYGWSGIVLLYESHAAIHTYPHRAAAFLDVFSCREFPVTQVTATLAAHFGRHRVAEQTLAERGEHWNADLQHEMLTWRSRR